MADAEWSATIVDRQNDTHKSSIIHSKAKVSSKVKIDPLSYIGENVSLDEGTNLFPMFTLKEIQK